MSKQCLGTNRVSQTPSRRSLRVSSEAASATLGGNLFHGSPIWSRNVGAPNGAADDVDWSDGHEDSNWLVSRTTLQWGGSPSHGVRYTPRPGPRVNGDGFTTVGPTCLFIIMTTMCNENKFSLKNPLRPKRGMKSALASPIKQEKGKPTSFGNSCSVLTATLVNCFYVEMQILCPEVRYLTIFSGRKKMWRRGHVYSALP